MVHDPSCSSILLFSRQSTLDIHIPSLCAFVYLIIPLIPVIIRVLILFTEIMQMKRIEPRVLHRSLSIGGGERPRMAVTFVWVYFYWGLVCVKTKAATVVIITANDTTGMSMTGLPDFLNIGIGLPAYQLLCVVATNFKAKFYLAKTRAVGSVIEVERISCGELEGK